ncbi:MAG: DUF507 family protein [Bryobacterales bacterium]
MLLPRPFVHFAARELGRRLAKEGALEVRDPHELIDAIDGVIVGSLELEDEINAEARELLNQYSDFMRKNEVTYTDMFHRVKRKILEERKVTPAASRVEGEKISREKIVELSHAISGKLPRLDGVRVLKGWNAVRLMIARELTNILAVEEKVDQRARQMIAGQQRKIVEGGEEWQVLHRRYYEQEMARLGIDMRMPETRES